MFCHAILLVAVGAWASDESGLKAVVASALSKPRIPPRAALDDAIAFIKPKLPAMPESASSKEWELQAGNLRQAALEKVYYRGAAARWRREKTKAVWLETIPGGPGYRIKKLRFEVVPGLWIPALLYEPIKLSGKTPVHLAVNGHDGKGKQADYKQIRCINLAKRGMIVLNLEWFGMGQLAAPGYFHGRLDQLNLCGTSGLAPFLLAMQRGIDILLEHPNADPERVAVHGLSGGGWQTITVSALDTRVTLCNPVAGYSGFKTRLEHFKDLGDSEQTPCDLATVCDYTHFTAMLAPRPTLLTYNAKDQCCFEAGYALPALVDAARPKFALYGKLARLRTHVNDDPGSHNFLRDNREALYGMVGDHFFDGISAYSAAEIPSDAEVKTAQQLEVELPKNNATFQSVALELSSRLPRIEEMPQGLDAAQQWRASTREKARTTVRFHRWDVVASRTPSTKAAGLDVVQWRLRIGNAWTVPVTELRDGDPQRTIIVLGDRGNSGLIDRATALCKKGTRVLAVDLFYFGDCKVIEKDYLMALMISTVGERPLGVQASQLVSVARWAKSQFPREARPAVDAHGPRNSLIALVAAASDEDAFARVWLNQSMRTLKEVIAENRSVDKAPELFCFGLLEAMDIRHLATAAGEALVLLDEDLPRPFSK